MARLQLSFPLKTSCTRGKQRLQGKFLRLIPAIIAVCSIGLVSCVPGVLSQKTKAPESEKGGTQSKLIKPRMEDKPVVQAVADKENGDEKKSVPQDSGHLVKPLIKAERPALDKPETSQEAGSGNESSEAPEIRKDTGEQPTADTRRQMQPDRRISTQSEDKPSDSSTGAPESGSKTDPPFKRHDHSKYLERIRNKAIDQVNKDKNCNYARICRDSTTDEWALTLYRWRENQYWFVTYVWDEVDDKWEESFTSDKRPLSGWKSHLRISSDGKECRVLKGSQR